MERRIAVHPTFRKVSGVEGCVWTQDGFSISILPGLSFDWRRRKALLAAIAANRNTIEIAQEFHVDHCTVLFWKRRMAAEEQPDIASWPEIDGD